VNAVRRRILAALVLKGPMSREALRHATLPVGKRTHREDVDHWLDVAVQAEEVRVIRSRPGADGVVSCTYEVTQRGRSAAGGVP
jgi:hypothetical protein